MRSRRCVSVIAALLAALFALTSVSCRKPAQNENDREAAASLLPSETTPQDTGATLAPGATPTPFTVFTPFPTATDASFTESATEETQYPQTSSPDDTAVPSASSTAAASASPANTGVPPTASPTGTGTSSPAPAVSSTPKPTPTATPDPIPANGYLSTWEKTRLVNFEHRLEDDYVPHDLINARAYLGDVCETKLDTTLIQLEVAVQLRKMLIAAKEAGVPNKYRLHNAYRSQRLQWEMWYERLASDPHYGDDPHHYPVGTLPGNASEHCAGLAIDITSVAHPYCDYGFGLTAEGIWLRDNSYKYGFILRYPAGKASITGVHYESWHFRYVGVELAKIIHDRGICLEEYYEGSPTPAPTRTPAPTPYVTGTPAASATPAPTQYASPTPTARPSNTPSPAPTGTVRPTNTPSPTPKPTNTAVPTSTPTATPAPTHTPTPAPTHTPTPAPTHTPTPAPTHTPTPAPTYTPTPAPTPEPTDTPEPTNTPAPTKTPIPGPTLIPSDGPSSGGN